MDQGIGHEAAIVVLPEGDTLSYFTEDGKIDALLAQVRERIDAFTPDASSEAGRKETKAFARAIVSTKTHLEGVGKGLAAEQKKIPGQIDKTRRRCWDQLEKWTAEVLEPVTAWQKAEHERKQRHLNALEYIQQSDRPVQSDQQGPLGIELRHFRERLDWLERLTVDSRFEEYESEIGLARNNAMVMVRAIIEAGEKREAEQRELAALRAEKDERDRLDRLAQEEEDRLEAERKAEAERQRIATAAAEQARIDAAAEAERLIEAERQRANDAIAAVVAAAEAVRKRLEQEAAAKAEQDGQRAANIEHRRGIDLAAKSALMTRAGLSGADAAAVVNAIAAGQIPAVTITY